MGSITNVDRLVLRNGRYWEDRTKEAKVNSHTVRLGLGEFI